MDVHPVRAIITWDGSIPPHHFYTVQALPVEEAAIVGMEMLLVFAV